MRVWLVPRAWFGLALQAPVQVSLQRRGLVVSLLLVSALRVLVGHFAERWDEWPPSLIAPLSRLVLRLLVRLLDASLGRFAASLVLAFVVLRLRTRLRLTVLHRLDRRLSHLSESLLCLVAQYLELLLAFLRRAFRALLLWLRVLLREIVRLVGQKMREPD